jgi:MFS family permease
VIRQGLTGLSKNVFLLALASLFGDVSTEMLYPVLPVFLTQTLRASGSIVGLVDGFAQATQNLVQGLSGTLSDKLRRRKGVALVGYLLAALGKPLMGLSGSWQQVFGARLLDRIGAGTRSAPRDALIASSVAEKDRGRAFGLEGLGDNAGAFLGPLLALFLLSTLHVGLRPIFYWAIVPGLIAFVLVLFVTERPIAVAPESRIDVHVRRLPSAYWRYLLATAVFGIGNSSNAFLILRTQEEGASLKATLLVYAGFNLAAALVSYPAGAWSDRWGRRNLLLAALAVFALAYLGFALGRGPAVLGPMFLFYGLHQGMFRAGGKALAADLVPEHQRATGIGWYSTCIGLLQLVAGVIGGMLWDRVGHAAVFYFGATFALLGIGALLVLVPGARPRHD